MQNEQNQRNTATAQNDAKAIRRTARRGTIGSGSMGIGRELSRHNATLPIERTERGKHDGIADGQAESAEKMRFAKDRFFAVEGGTMKKLYLIPCVLFIVIFPIFCIATVYTEEVEAIPTTAIVTVTETETEQETEPVIPHTEQWVATAYCPCEKCCGKWAFNRPNGIVYGAGGYELIQGKSMASALPFGTVVRITGADGYNGEYICHDRPADWVIERCHGKIVDIYFNSHAQAVEFGKRTVTVEFVEGV